MQTWGEKSCIWLQNRVFFSNRDDDGDTAGNGATDGAQEQQDHLISIYQFHFNMISSTRTAKDVCTLNRVTFVA